MRKGIIGFLLGCLVTFLLGGMFNLSIISKAEEMDIEVNINENCFLGNEEIETSIYLYNFDDSADYIYVDYKNTGYAVFARETMELLEYAPEGELPYSSLIEKNYYGGPSKYYVKEGTRFKDLSTGETYLFSSENIESYANSIRTTLSILPQKEEIELLADLSVYNLQSESTPTIPPLDEFNPISPTEGATYVDNYDYF